MSRNYRVIDLFSGAGGLSLGFELANFKNIFSVEIMPDYCKTYKTNFIHHNLFEKDIKQLKKEEIKKNIKNKNVDVIAGGPPCQGFSIAGNIGRTFTDDPRNSLFKEFARIVSVVNPKIFVMENVARLFTHNKGQTKKEIIQTFQKLGYNRVVAY